MAALLSVAWLSGCASQATSTEEGAAPDDAYTQLAAAYLERDNLPRAISALDRALELNPEHAEALQLMAMVHQRQGEASLADDYFQRALQADGDFTRTRNNYAAYLFGQGHTAKACHQLELASEDTQYPNRALLFNNLGQCQRELGNLNAARHSLMRAQSIDARNPNSYFALAEIEYAQGNYSRSWEQLQSFIGLVGVTPESRRLASHIAAARGDDDTAFFVSEQLGSFHGAP